MPDNKIATNLTRPTYSTFVDRHTLTGCLKHICMLFQPLVNLSEHQGLCSNSECLIAERSQGQWLPLPMCPSTVLCLVRVSSSKLASLRTKALHPTLTDPSSSFRCVSNRCHIPLYLYMCFAIHAFECEGNGTVLL